MSVTVLIPRNFHSSQNTTQCLFLLHIHSLHSIVILEVPYVLCSSSPPFCLSEDLLYGYKSRHWMSRKLGPPSMDAQSDVTLHYSLKWCVSNPLTYVSESLSQRIHHMSQDTAQWLPLNICGLHAIFFNLPLILICVFVNKWWKDHHTPVLFIDSIPCHGIEALWRLHLSGNRAWVMHFKT